MNRVSKNLPQKPPLNITITPHFHYDYLWCAPPDELGGKTAMIIHDGLRLLRKYPTYKFIVDGVMAVEYFRLHYPNEWEEFRINVHKHRIEIAGGHIIAPDNLIPCGESLVRQYLYGMRYLHKELGQTSTVGYFVDSFGQTPQLPQILKKAGITRFICMRGIGARKIPSEFWWEAPDGTKILTHYLSGAYSYVFPPFVGSLLCPFFPFFPLPVSFNWIPQTFRMYELITKLIPPLKPLLNWIATWRKGTVLDGTTMGGLRFTTEWRARQATTKNLLVLLGSDNTPLNPEVCDIAAKFNRSKFLNPEHNNLQIGFPSDFFLKLEQSHSQFGIIRSTEFTFAPDLHSGTFGCRPRLKKRLRTVERDLYITEWIGTMATIFAHWTYPKTLIAQAVRRELCAGFHDGICGCHTDDADKAIMNQLRLSEHQLKRQSNEALLKFSTIFRISSKESETVPIMIINPLGWQRTTICGLNLPRTLNGWTGTLKNGTEIPIQENKINFPPEPYVTLIPNLPSSGGTILYCKPLKDSTQTTNFSKILSTKINITTDTIQISSSFFNATIKNGLFVHLQLKDIVIHNEETGIGGITIQEDRGDTYYIGRDRPKKAWTHCHAEVMENGPVRIVIRIRGLISEPNTEKQEEIWQDIIFPLQADPIIEFHTYLSNQFRNIRVQSFYPMQNEQKNDQINSKTIIRSEIPYGFHVREPPAKGMPSYAALKPNFSHYDRIKPVIHWLNTTHESIVGDNERNWGITILNDSCPEHEIGPNYDSCFITLFRSVGILATLAAGEVPRIAAAPYTVPEAYEICDLDFHTALCMHNGNFELNAMQINQSAYSFITPPLTISLKNTEQLPQMNMLENNAKFPMNTLDQGEWSLFWVESGNIVVRVVKMPEDNVNGIILRILEVSGKAGNVMISFQQPISSVMLIDLLEKPIQTLAIENMHSFKFEVKSQEILTFLVKLE